MAIRGRRGGDGGEEKMPRDDASSGAGGSRGGSAGVLDVLGTPRSRSASAVAERETEAENENFRSNQMIDFLLRQDFFAEDERRGGDPPDGDPRLLPRNLLARTDEENNRETTAEPIQLARSVSPQASDRDYPPEIWTSRPCIVIQSLPQRVTEQEIRLLFEGYAITTVAFDANHSAWIRLHNKHRESIPSLERHLRRSVLGGRNLKELVSFCSDGPALFVGNMPEVVDDDALRSIFQRHGKIDRAFIARNADGRSKGFGFVEYTVVSDSWADEVEIMHLSDQNLFIERARWRVFSLHQAVSLGVYGLPIHSLRQARMTLLGLFGRYGITLGHYIDTQNSMAFVDFFTHDQADNAWRNLNGYQIEGKRLKVFFTSPGKRAVDRRLEHEEAKTLESIEHRLQLSDSRVPLSGVHLRHELPTRGPFGPRIHGQPTHRHATFNLPHPAQLLQPQLTAFSHRGVPQPQRTAPVAAIRRPSWPMSGGRALPQLGYVDYPPPGPWEEAAAFHGSFPSSSRGQAHPPQAHDLYPAGGGAAQAAMTLYLIPPESGGQDAPMRAYGYHAAIELGWGLPVSFGPGVPLPAHGYIAAGGGPPEATAGEPLRGWQPNYVPPRNQTSPRSFADTMGLPRSIINDGDGDSDGCESPRGSRLQQRTDRSI